MFDFAMGQNSLASLALSALSALLFLLVWFFVSRASVRANQQIELLQEIAEQQRQQTELLKILTARAKGAEPERGRRGFRSQPAWIYSGKIKLMCFADPPLRRVFCLCFPVINLS